MMSCEGNAHFCGGNLTTGWALICQHLTPPLKHTGVPWPPPNPTALWPQTQTLKECSACGYTVKTSLEDWSNNLHLICLGRFHHIFSVKTSIANICNEQVKPPMYFKWNQRINWCNFKQNQAYTKLIWNSFREFKTELSGKVCFSW